MAKARISEALARVSVETRSGEATTIGELVSEKSTLLLFLRHFGCIGCTAQVDELNPRLRELETIGVQVLLIGSGEAQFIDEFLRRHTLIDQPVKVVVDPELRAYAAAELKRGAWATFSPSTIVSRLRAAGKGTQSYRGSGDLYQQGGAMLINATGDVVLHFANRDVGNRVDLNDVVDEAIRMQQADMGAVL